jgi:hypothetical protein
MIQVQEKDNNGKTPSGGQKFKNITMMMAMLCANCTVSVYKLVEAAFSDSVGESE